MRCGMPLTGDSTDVHGASQDVGQLSHVNCNRAAFLPQEHLSHCMHAVILCMCSGSKGWQESEVALTAKWHPQFTACSLQLITHF